METVRVEYDDRIEEVAEKFHAALKRLGVPIRKVRLGDEPVVLYEIGEEGDS